MGTYTTFNVRAKIKTSGKPLISYEKNLLINEIDSEFGNVVDSVMDDFDVCSFADTSFHATDYLDTAMTRFTSVCRNAVVEVFVCNEDSGSMSRVLYEKGESEWLEGHIIYDEPSKIKW